MNETDQPKDIQSVKLEGTFTGYVASGKAQDAPDSQNAVATADGSPLKDPVDLRDFNINWEYTLNITLILIGVIAGAMALNYLLKHTILAAFDKFTSGKKNVFIKVIVKQQLVNRALAMIPPIIVYIILPTLFNAQTHGVALEWAQRLCFIYMTLVGVRLVNTAIGSLHDIIYVRAPMGHKPLKGFVQVVQLLLWCVAVILIISVLINKNPTALIAGLGAASAVLMLVFKDPIMSFAAGIQLSTNDMLRVGDWITMPKYNIDGDVIEVNLNTIKVRNFDNTIITVPPYVLVMDSFQNWRGMSESGGRRVKRSLYIDMESVRFCDEKMLEKYRKIALIKDYIDTKQKELGEYNAQNGIDSSVLVNGRRQTNIGVFRAYIEAYLKASANVNHGLTCMVRQLQPTERGIPLELYFFTADVRWIPYENIQSDVFDHLMAAVSEFDLNIFQNISGADIRSLGRGA